jgi:hypothetical protein
MTLAANSVGTLGGGASGTAGMTYLWLRRRGVNCGVGYTRLSRDSASII